MQNNIATNKPPPDGLTKKQRRALKVQQNEIKTEPPTIKPEIPTKTEPQTDPTKLTEKQLRKLEWEKKLAEQKKSEKKDDTLSKAELKAKRREQQEAQRSNKTQAVKEKKVEPPKKEAPKPAKPAPIKTEQKPVKRVHLFQHLYTETSYKPEFENSLVNLKNIHPAFIRLGVQLSSKKILGSNARCLALLSAVKYLVRDLKTPPKQEFCRYLESVLQSCVLYLQYRRPFAVSMTNALRHFKVQLTQEATKLPENIKKDFLLKVIDTYIVNEIEKAGEAISLRVKDKIVNGDVILIYSCSSLINQILLDAHKDKKQFEVIIVDGRPFLEGRQALKRLVKEGIHCTYITINSISFVMNSVTKVLLGAHALLANGYVMSRIGTSQVALVSRAYNKPVLVCCETYKFSERVQTDSFVYNEIGCADDLIEFDTIDTRSPLIDWKEKSKVILLNLLYDVTPPDLVTAVVTELAVLPCTSVPVVLRVKPVDLC